MTDILTILQSLPFKVDGIYERTNNGLVKGEDCELRIDFNCLPMAFIVANGNERVEPLNLSLCSDEVISKIDYSIVYFGSKYKQRTVVDTIVKLLIENDCTSIQIDKNSQSIKQFEKISGGEKFIKINFTYSYYSDECEDLKCLCDDLSN